MDVELDGHLRYVKCQENELSNSSKRYSSKIAKGMLGKMDLKVSKDRNTNFEPKILLKLKKIFYN